MLDRLEATAARGVTAPPERLDAALEGEPYPIDCLSPVLLRAVQTGHDSAVAPWLELPDLPGNRTWAGTAGIRIHFTTEAASPHRIPLGKGETAGGPAPRYVERLGEALAAAVDLLDGLGFGVAERNPWIDVYVADTGPGISGYVVPAPLAPGSTEEHRGGSLVMSRALRDPGPAAAHQLAHLVLLGYSYREPVWWHEATAAWVGLQAAGNPSADTQALLARVARPEDGLDTDDLLRLRGNLLFPAFLALSDTSANVVRRIWGACATLSGPNVLDALDRVGRESGLGSAADLLRAYHAAWIADAAGRDRLLAELGLFLPFPGLGAELAAYPASGVTAHGPVRPLGATFLHLRSGLGPGGLAVSVRGNPDAAFDALLLVRRAPGARMVPVPVPIDEENRARIRYPWGEVGDAVLMLVGLPGEADLVASYTVRYRPDIPFDLMEFTAEPTEEGVRLLWSTDAEVDLFGWNVYRATAPASGFRRINGVPIPAGGGDAAPASYSFLDGSPGAAKVYYRLEAVTLDGFTQTSHQVGARPVPRGR
jgi:hypothetical protein